MLVVAVQVACQVMMTVGVKLGAVGILEVQPIYTLQFIWLQFGHCLFGIEL